MQHTYHKPSDRTSTTLLSPQKSTAEQILLQLLFVGLGALCTAGKLLFGVRPFGVALAAAGTSLFPAITAGVLLFSFVARDHLSLFTMALLILLRGGYNLWLSRHKPHYVFFDEKPSIRVLGATLVFFATGLYRVIANGFLFYHLFGLLLATAAAALSSFLYCGLFSKKDRLFPYCKEIGLVTLVLTGIFAMRSVSFFGVYPAAVAAALGALLLVVHRGLSLGAVGGALAGLCFDYRTAPAFLLYALCFGLLEKSSRGGGVLAGSTVAALYAYGIAGGEGVLLLLPAMLTAGALLLAGDSAGIVEGSDVYRRIRHRRRAVLHSAQTDAQADGNHRLQEIAGAFLDLSGTFYELSNRLRRPGTADLRRLCDRAFDEACPNCRHREICWGSEYRLTADTIGALVSRLHSHGAVTQEMIPPALTDRCADISRILKSINEGAIRLTDESLRGDKTSVVAADYAAIGRLLNETLEDGKESFSINLPLSERIAEKLQRMGYSVGSVAVCGLTHRRVILRDVRLPGRHIKLRELRRLLEQHCHFELGEAKVSESDGICDLIYHERTRLQSVTVKETRAKSKDGRHCGDSVVTISTDRGYDYALLCDGMGSGTGAALTSALASSFLARMLQAGSRADTALRMLNGFLASRSTRENESSTTVDLLEIDRISGEASLFKCGAAPTYLLRNGEITRFFSHTAPVGILESLDAERIRFALEPGDILVQISDGITGGEEECGWLAEMLATRFDGDTDKFTRQVLNRADSQEKDDLSVLITEIKDTPILGEEQVA